MNKYKPLLPALAMAVCFCLSRADVIADVTYASLPATVTMTPGVSFVTQTQISSTNNSLGAFSVLIEYDTNVFKLVGVSPQSGSAFSTNLFVDLASLGSGVTRVVGFQTTTANSQPANAFLNLTWQTVGTTILNSIITNIVETSIDSSWQPIQSWTPSTSATLNQNSSDGSGMPDWWELMYFGHLGVNPSADADNNGLSNLEKYLAGLNPTNPASTVLIKQIELTNTTALIHFNTVLGRTYSIEKTSSLTPNSWSVISTPISGTGSEQMISDPYVSNQPAQFFYRLIVTP